MSSSTSAWTPTAWWIAVVCGVLVVLTGVMPWWTTQRAAFLGRFADSGDSHIGLAAGPTAWCGIGLAAAAAVIALAQVRPTVRLPRHDRPAVVAAWLAAGALVCVVVRSASLARSSSSLLGITSSENHLAGGAVLANVAVMIQLAALVVRARQSGESLRPDLALSLTRTPGTDLTGTDPTGTDPIGTAASTATPDQSPPGRPGQVTAAAMVCFALAAVTALVSVAVIMLGVGLGSIPLLYPAGAAIALLGLPPAALCGWLILLGRRLVRRSMWGRTASLITMGVLGCLGAISALTTSGDPTVPLLVAGGCWAAFTLLCTAPARRTAWS